VYTRQQIAITRTEALQARFDALEAVYCADEDHLTMSSAEIEEMEEIDRELDARYMDQHEPVDFDQHDRNAYESERIANHFAER
jgi:hypothetical protein